MQLCGYSGVDNRSTNTVSSNCRVRVLAQYRQNNWQRSKKIFYDKCTQ